MIYIFLLAIAGSIYIFFPKPSKTLRPPYDAILILGCPAKEDGTISSTLKKRCDYALHLYHQHAAPIIIVSGSNVKNKYKEADIMAAYLHGLDLQVNLKKEEKAGNTFQNIKYTKELYPYERILVITSPFHVRRTSFFLKKFYLKSDVAAYKNNDPITAYLMEYTRLWICLYYEIKLTYNKNKL